MTVTIEDVERTSRTTTTAQWGVAAVVMVGSAASAGIGFAHVGQHVAYAAIGVITGLGVDLALAYGLIIGRRLRAVGLTTSWGTFLTWLTGAMTLCLNSGAAALQGQWVLAVAHAFLPVLLVVLCEAGSEAELKLHRLAQQALADERAQREAQLAAERAAYDAERSEQIRTQEREAARRDRELTEQRQAREHEARQVVAVLASVLTLRASMRRSPSRPKSRPRHGSGPVPRRPGASLTPLRSGQKSTSQARQSWIEAQLKAGVDVTTADVKAQFPDAANAARDVKTVRARLAQEQSDRRGSVHVIGGKR